MRLTTACTTDVLAVQSCRTTLFTCRTCNLVGCECITQPWPGPCMVISHTPCICMLNNKCAVQVSQQPHRPAGAPEQQLLLTAWRTLFATCIHPLPAKQCFIPTTTTPQAPALLLEVGFKGRAAAHVGGPRARRCCARLHNVQQLRHEPLQVLYRLA